MILACDVGGTNVRLALFERHGGKLIRRHFERFASRDYPDLEAVVQVFLERNPGKVDKAAFGVPGPVLKGKAYSTNLPWQVEEASLVRVLGISAVRVINDLVGLSASLPYLTENELLTLHAGEVADVRNMFAVLAPGTGLGQGFLYKDQSTSRAFASEGGHADFAPTKQLEIELLAHLQQKFERVSYERLLSGPGLVNIYGFLKDTGKAAEPEALRLQMQQADPAMVIATNALAKGDDICQKALDIFVSILGAQAGNLVLTLMATGGIYLGGGIPPKIKDKLTDGTLVKAYLDKGRLASVVRKVPLHVICDDTVALIGAASIAASLS